MQLRMSSLVWTPHHPHRFYYVVAWLHTTHLEAFIVILDCMCRMQKGSMTAVTLWWTTHSTSWPRSCCLQVRISCGACAGCWVHSALNSLWLDAWQALSNFASSSQIAGREPQWPVTVKWTRQIVAIKSGMNTSRNNFQWNHLNNFYILEK